MEDRRGQGFPQGGSRRNGGGRPQGRTPFTDLGVQGAYEGPGERTRPWGRTSGSSAQGAGAAGSSQAEVGQGASPGCEDTPFPGSKGPPAVQSAGQAHTVHLLCERSVRQRSGTRPRCRPRQGAMVAGTRDGRSGARWPHPELTLRRPGAWVLGAGLQEATPEVRERGRGSGTDAGAARSLGPGQGPERWSGYPVRDAGNRVTLHKATGPRASSRRRGWAPGPLTPPAREGGAPQRPARGRPRPSPPARGGRRDGPGRDVASPAPGTGTPPQTGKNVQEQTRKWKHYVRANPGGRDDEPTKGGVCFGTSRTEARVLQV